MTYRKAIIYRRVSTAAQLNGNALLTQQLQCEEWIQARYPELEIKTRTDVGSGWNKNKREPYQLLEKMQNIVDSCTKTLIVIYCIDRFLRDVKTAEEILPKLKENKNRIVFLLENLDYHNFSGKDVYLKIIRGVESAQTESDVKSKRMKDAWKTKCMLENSPELEDEEWKLEYDSESESDDENKSALNRRKIEPVKVQETKLVQAPAYRLANRPQASIQPPQASIQPPQASIYQWPPQLLIDNHFDDPLFSKKEKIKRLIQTCSEGRYTIKSLNQHLLQLSSVAFSLQVEEVPTSWDGMATLLNLFEICWVPEIPKGEWTAEKAKAFN